MEDLTACGYKSTELLGEGGQGKVLKVKSLNSGTEYALKIYPEKVSGGKSYGLYEMREIDILFRLSHPYLLHGIKLMTPRTCSLLKERFGVFIPLAQRTLGAAGMSLTTAAKIKICLQVSYAIKFLHDMGTLHGDIKLDNILLFSDDKSNLSDFGGAIYMSGKETASHGFTVSTEYWPPEAPNDLSDAIRKPKANTTARDVWTWGMTMLYMFTALAASNTIKKTLADPTKRDRFYKAFATQQARVKYIEDAMQGGSIMYSVLPQMAKLIAGMTATFPEERITMDDVIKQLRAIDLKQHLSEWPIPEPVGLELKPEGKFESVKEGVVKVLLYIHRWASQSDIVTTEQVFLATDLYYRAAPYYEALTGNDDYDRKNYTLLFTVVLRMATKLAPSKFVVDSGTIAQVSGAVHSAELSSRMNTIERSIVEISGGVLYRRHFFHKCESLKQYQDAYKEFSNKDYLLISLSEWLAKHKSQWSIWLVPELFRDAYKRLTE